MLVDVEALIFLKDLETFWNNFIKLVVPRFAKRVEGGQGVESLASFNTVPLFDSGLPDSKRHWVLSFRWFYAGYMVRFSIIFHYIFSWSSLDFQSSLECNEVEVLFFRWVGCSDFWISNDFQAFPGQICSTFRPGGAAQRLRGELHDALWRAGGHKAQRQGHRWRAVLEISLLTPENWRLFLHISSGLYLFQDSQFGRCFFGCPTFWVIFPGAGRHSQRPGKQSPGGRRGASAQLVTDTELRSLKLRD